MKVLIIDFLQGRLTDLARAIGSAGLGVETALDSESGLVLVARHKFQVALVNLEPNGLELIIKLRQKMPVILMAIPSPDSNAIIQAVQLGVYDCIKIPESNEETLEMIEVIKRSASSQLWKNIITEEYTQSPIGKAAMIGRSRLMQDVYKQIGRVTNTSVTVLIRGETGTGKELVAHALHENSNRNDKPYVIVNCTAIPETLIESELFGHEKGAFTDAISQRPGKFEQANGGTIFLDEIGDMSPSIQVKLLRVIQDKVIERVGGINRFRVDVRIIAATHRDIEKGIESKLFRQDLYYRLNDATIYLPPLRKRKSDIAELVHLFVRIDAPGLLSVGSKVSSEALDYLQKHDWPGNIRELRSVIQRALLLAKGDRVSLGIIREALANPFQIPEPVAVTSSIDKYSLEGYIGILLESAEQGERTDVSKTVMDWAEKEIIVQAMRLTNGNQQKAAKLLGMSRQTLIIKCAQYGI